MRLLSVRYAFASLQGLTLIIPIVFDFSDGIVTSLEAELPPELEPFFQMEDHDLDSDHDDPDEVPAEGGSAEAQLPIDTAAPMLPERTVKAYVVKHTAYRTSVDDSSSLRCPLTDEMQPACNNLVYLFRGDYILPIRFSKVPQRLCQVYLPVCG